VVHVSLIFAKSALVVCPAQSEASTPQFLVLFHASDGSSCRSQFWGRGPGLAVATESLFLPLALVVLYSFCFFCQSCEFLWSSLSSGWEPLQEEAGVILELPDQKARGFVVQIAHPR
jgi:hypothetical protein